MIANILISKIVGSALRHLVGAGGAFLVANGLADASSVETASGCAVSLGAFALSIAEKRWKS